MKTLTLIIGLFLLGSLHAQFDDKFYYPQKDWEAIADSIDFKEIEFNITAGKITGLELNPQGNFKGNILFFHGAGGNVSTYIPMTLPLAEQGYRIMMVDVRGYGKSEGTPTHVGIAEDAPEILEWLLHQDKYKGEKLIVYGASMGTQIATHLTAQFPEKIDYLILDGAMTSFTDIALFSAPEEQKMVIQQFVSSPYSAIEDIQNIKGTPVLIIHSEGDSAVPLSMGEKLYETALEPKFFFKYEGEHLEAAQKHIEELIPQIEQLMK